MSYTDYSVELGAGNDLPELDEHLPGPKRATSSSFEAPIGDSPVQVEVVVKQVQEKVLPEHRRVGLRGVRVFLPGRAAGGHREATDREQTCAVSVRPA